MEPIVKKWYQKPAWIYALTVLVYPIGVFLLWKSKEIKKAVKIILTIIIPVLIIFGAIDDFKKTKFNEKLVANGELFVHFRETEMNANQDVKLYFKFANNEITDFRSFNNRYSYTNAYDTRFNILDKVDNTIKISTPYNGNNGGPSLSAADSWDIKLTISFDGIGDFKFPEDSLKGTVTLEQYMGTGSDRRLVRKNYDAKFIINIPNGTLGTNSDQSKKAENEQDAQNKAMEDELNKRNSSQGKDSAKPSNSSSSNVQGDHTPTQSEMNESAQRQYTISDSLLNVLYKEIASRITPEQKKQLKAEEVEWVKKKESACADEKNGGGSMAPMNYYGCLKTMTDNRIQELKTEFPK